MSSAIRTLRIAVVAWTGAAVGFSQLPTLHVHPAGFEGRAHSLVHQHSVEGGAPGVSVTSTPAHGNHDRALFLTQVYHGVSRFVPQHPALVEAATAFLPFLGAFEFVQTDDARPAHGPPGSTDLARAPPA